MVSTSPASSSRRETTAGPWGPSRCGGACLVGRIRPFEGRLSGPPRRGCDHDPGMQPSLEMRRVGYNLTFIAIEISIDRLVVGRLIEISEPTQCCHEPILIRKKPLLHCLYGIFHLECYGKRTHVHL